MSARTPKSALLLALLAIALQVMVCAVDGRWCFRALLAADSCADHCCEVGSVEVDEHSDHDLGDLSASFAFLSHNSDCCLEQQPEHLAQPVDHSTTVGAGLAALDRAADVLRIASQPPARHAWAFHALPPPGVELVRATVLLI